MIALITGSPKFECNGDQALLTFPSGKGGKVQVSLNRNQLCHLMQRSRMAMLEAFEPPQENEAEIIALVAKAAG